MQHTKQTTEITLAKASLLNIVGTTYNEANPEISKITFAVQRILNQTNKPKQFEDYTEAQSKHKANIENIDMKYASTEVDSPKLLLDDEGNKIYTAAADANRKQDTLAENKRWRIESEELLSKTIEVNTHFVDTEILVKAGLTMEFIDTFDGLILNAEDLYKKILADKPGLNDKPGKTKIDEA